MSGLTDRIGEALRAERTLRQMSLAELSELSGVSKTNLSYLERGSGNPSIETLWRISQALGVPLGHLLREDESPRVRLIEARAADALSAESGMTAWPLHSEGRSHRSEVYDIELPRGTDQRSDAHLPHTEELIVCVQGRILAGPYGEEVELTAGDSVWFRADVAHHYEALEDSRTICVMLYVGGGS